MMLMTVEETDHAREAARRFLADLEVLGGLPETPCGTRSLLREAGELTKRLLEQGEQGYAAWEVHNMARRLAEQAIRETYRGPAASLRRAYRALAGAADAIDTGRRSGPSGK